MPRGVYKRTPEMNAAMSKAKTGRSLSQEHCAAISKALTGVPKTLEHNAANSKAKMGHSTSEETRKKISAAERGVPNSPEHNAAISEARRNSEAAKAAYENMRGGQDIIQHHWLYDDADLSKYTMPMTRSDHMAMHHRMRADGYVVPHINSATDGNELWGYR